MPSTDINVVNPETFNWYPYAISICIVIVIIVIYMTRKKTEEPTPEKPVTQVDVFSIENEVEKLRTKQTQLLGV